MRASIFKLQKPKKFNPQPRYWDPEKEEREARMKKYEKKNIENPEFSKDDFRRELKYRWDLNRPSRHSFNMKNTSGKRFLIILALLILLIYIIYLLG